MANPNVCDLTQWLKLVDWLTGALEDVAQTPNLSVRLASRQLTEVEVKAPYGADASLAEAVRAIGARATAELPAWWGDFAAGLEQAMADIAPATLLWSDPGLRRLILDATKAPDLGQARASVADWLQEAGYAWRAEVVRRPGLAGVMRVLFARDRPLAASTALFEPVTPGPILSEKERATLAEVFDHPEQWPRLAKVLDEVTKTHLAVIDGMELVEEAIKPLLAKYGVEGHAPTTLLGIYEWLWPRLTPAEQESLSAVLVRAGFPKSPEIEHEIQRRLFDAAAADVRQQLEAIPRRFPRLAAALEKVDTFERSLGLVRLGLLVENFIDMVVKGLLAGHGLHSMINAGIDTWNYTRATRASLEFPLSAEEARYQLGVSTTMDDIMRRYGRSLRPEGVSAAAERLFATPEFQVFDITQAPIWRLPGVQRLAGPPPAAPPARAAAQVAAGIAQPGRVKPWQWAMRAPVLGIAWSTVWVRVLMTAQESAFRKAAFDFKFLEFMHKAGEPAFADRAAEVIRAHGLDPAPYLAAFEGAWDRSAEGAWALARKLYPDRPTLAGQLRSLRNFVLDQAEDEGLGESRRVHYDYLNRTGLDDLLGGFFKYHIWATRNLPFYTQELARHYTVLRTWLRWMAIREHEREQGELPRGQADTAVPLPESEFLALVFPQSVATMQLLAIVSLLSQVEEPWLGPGTAYDQVRRTLGGVGLSPLFRWQLLLWLMHYDTRADPPRLYNPAGIPARSLGVDPTGLPGAFLRGVRDAIPVPPGGRRVSGETLTGSATFDRAVWRELVAMSVEETGRANAPQYLVAMADPDDPLFQEAAARVRRRRGPLELVNWVSPYRVDVQGQTEAELRLAAGQPLPEPPPPVEGEGVLGLYRPEGAEPAEAPRLSREEILSGPPGLWTLYVPTDLREAQIKAGFALAQLAAARGKVPSRSYLEAKLPWFLAYREWAAQQPPDGRSVNTFLAGHWSLP